MNKAPGAVNAEGPKLTKGQNYKNDFTPISISTENFVRFAGTASDADVRVRDPGRGVAEARSSAAQIVHGPIPHSRSGRDWAQSATNDHTRRIAVRCIGKLRSPKTTARRSERDDFHDAPSGGDLCQRC